jgi:uncharacterized protein YggU (UPF0235/DUF167 family)
MPRSPRARIDGVRDGRLVVRVTAPPVDQAANEAVVAVIADALDVARSAIHIIAGRTSRNKSLAIDRADAAAVRLRLGL